DEGRVVLGEAEAVAPQIRRRLILFLVAPRLLRGRPLLGDLARGRAGLHRVDRIVEPFKRGRVRVLLLLGRLLADAIGAVIAGFVAVPGERGQIHEHDVAGLDDAVGEVAPVRPGVGARRYDDVLDVLHAGDVVEIFHQVRGDLVLRDAGTQELHALPVGGITDRADDSEAFLLVDVRDRARLHHRRHAVGPGDALLREDLDHIDVDEVAAKLLTPHAVALHLVDDRIGKLGDLLGRGRTGCTFDPGEGVADVLLRQPG